MGIGNLENVIEAYVGEEVPRAAAAATGRRERPRLRAPLLRLVARRATPRPGSCSPGSATTPPSTTGGCAPRRRSSRRWRDDPEALDERGDLVTQKATLEETLPPGGGDRRLRDAPTTSLDATRRRQPRRRSRPTARSASSSPSRRASWPNELGADPELYRVLRPEALAALIYLAGKVKAISGEREAADGHERDPRPGVPGPPRRGQPGGDAGVLAPHDRVVVRHPPRLRVRRAGRGVPVRARPPARARDPRLRLRAGGDPRDRERVRAAC